MRQILLFSIILLTFSLYGYGKNFDDILLSENSEIIDFSKECTIVKTIEEDGTIIYSVIAAIGTALLPEAAKAICMRTVGDPVACQAVYDATSALVAINGLAFHKGSTKALAWIANRGRLKSTVTISSTSLHLARSLKTVFLAYRKMCKSGNSIQWENVNISPSTYSATKGIYPEASSRLLDCSELVNKTKKQLGVMRNEIFARHGYKFKTVKYIKYFENQLWYNNMTKNSNSSEYIYRNYLTKIERENIALIREYEDVK